MGLVLTGYDDLPYGHIGEESWRRYASYQGYDFLCVRKFHEGSHPAWQKMEIIRDHIKDHDWVFWTDIDSVCTNKEINVDRYVPKDPNIVSASRDWGRDPGWSAGHMVLVPEADEFLARAQKLVQWKNTPLWDQTAMRDSAGPNTVNVLPRRAMNSISADVWPNTKATWEPGDFLVHITGIPHDKRTPHMEKFFEIGEKE